MVNKDYQYSIGKKRKIIVTEIDSVLLSVITVGWTERFRSDSSWSLENVTQLRQRSLALRKRRQLEINIIKSLLEIGDRKEKTLLVGN